MVCLSRRERTESPARSARHHFGAQIQSGRALCRGCLFRRLRTAVPSRVSEKKHSPRQTGVERDHSKHQRSVFPTRKEHGARPVHPQAPARTHHRGLEQSSGRAGWFGSTSRTFHGAGHTIHRCGTEGLSKRFVDVVPHSRGTEVGCNRQKSSVPHHWCFRHTLIR